MKKALTCLIALALLIVMTSCEKINKNTENMYFASPNNSIVVDGKWTRVPIEVCRYTGGDSYTVAYTFPDAEIYIFTIFGDTLYYMTAFGGSSIMRVDLNGGETDIYAEFEYERARWILADKYGVYLSCRVVDEEGNDADSLYKITESEKAIICGSISSMYTWAITALDGNGLVFNDYDETFTIKRYDTETGEISTVAKDVPRGRLDYSNGYVYTTYENCYRIDEKTGESEFIAQGAGYRVHDGWVYYVDDRFGERGSKDSLNLEVMRRNFDTGAVETCGKTAIPYLGAISFEDSIEFGENGFIIYCTERKERTEYMYFKYGEYGGTWLTQQASKN